MKKKIKWASEAPQPPPFTLTSGKREGPASAAAFLQERLRVSAGALKALQTQIDEMQVLLAALRDGRQDAEKAVQLYEEKLTARERALDRVDERIALAADRTEALSNMVESAEVNLAVLLSRVARLTSRSDVGRG